MQPFIRIGTCSWKYASWRGLVYSEAAKPDYLGEYAQHFDAVEVDQWFWSLFGADKVVLPDPAVAAAYADAVPDGFRFAVKLPNALTLTHLHPHSKSAPLVPNPHFLSVELLHAFLERVAPMRAKLGPLMLQFGYLNRQMMPSQEAFLARLATFVRELPAGYAWAVESRNPNHLNDRHFEFLRRHGLAHVFLQGYYLPPIFDVHARHAAQLGPDVIVRLHGPDRAGMEEKAGADWSRIVAPRDDDLDKLAIMLRDLRAGRRNVWLFANNHFEGCAPRTIARIRERMG